MKNKPLTEKDLVIGGKYVPHSKSAEGWGNLDSSREWERKGKSQGFLYYNGKNKFGKFVFASFCAPGNGDFFLPSDMTPYIETDKEETVEEAAIKHGKTATLLGTSNTLSFEMGATWQKERDNKLIDELINGLEMAISTHGSVGIMRNEVEPFLDIDNIHNDKMELLELIEKANKHLNQ